MEACELESPQRRAALAALVAAAQQGDREAFGLLAEQYERAVFATALKRLRNYAEAQELTQEVFVQALRKIAQLREPEALGGWLRSITVRMAINRQVRRGPQFSAEPESLSNQFVEDETPLGSALREERRQQVHDGLERLGPIDRATLEAFYLEGQSLIQMSDTFASPVGTIKRRLHVARKRLAKELEELVAV